MGISKDKLDTDSSRQSLVTKFEELKKSYNKLLEKYYAVVPRDSCFVMPTADEGEMQFLDFNQLGDESDELLLKSIEMLENECKTLREAYDAILSQRTSY